MSLASSLETLNTVGSWIMTYVVHSTVLLALAWAACTALRRRRLAVQELLWRGALLGGILTATLQLGLGVQPYAGTMRVGQTHAAAAAAPVTAQRAVEPQHQAGTAPVAASLQHAPRATAPGEAGPALAGAWPALLALVWLLGAIVGTVRLGRSAMDLRRLLADRRFLTAGALPALLEHLQQSMGLRRRVLLSSSDALPIPFATGVRRPEICLPGEVLHRMSASDQESLLAHELAHVTRRDPAWLLLGRFLTAVLFIQPLNFVATRRLADLSECLSDDRAAECTGRRRDLARCLVELASRLQPGPRPTLLAAALPTRSRLGLRVSRLLTTATGEHRCTRWAVPALVGALAVAAAVLPIAAPGHWAEASVFSATEIGDRAEAALSDGAAEPRPPEAGEPQQAATAQPAEEPGEQEPARPQAGEHRERVVVHLDELDPEVAARVTELAERIRERVQVQSPRIEEITRRLREQYTLSDEEQQRLQERSRKLAQELSQHVIQVVERVREGARTDDLDHHIEGVGEQMAELEAELDALVEGMELSEVDLEELEVEVNALVESTNAADLDELRELLDDFQVDVHIDADEIRDIVDQAMEQVNVSLEEAFDSAEDDHQ